MAIGTLKALSTKGVRGELKMQLDAIPDLWIPHCTMLDSNTEVEPFAWAGAVPQPRELIGDRHIKEIQSFTYDITNREYELSVLFPRKWWEDDQTGQIKMRLGEMAGRWKSYKPFLFNALLEAGATGLAYDGETFFDDTREEGSSGAIDNDFTSVAAAADAIPTAAEWLAQLAVIKAYMMRYLDDEGQPANLRANSSWRIFAPPEAIPELTTAMQSTLISNTDNVWGRGLAEVDENPFGTYSATTVTAYVHAVGDAFKGMIHQQRTPLEILIFDDPKWIDKHNGVLVTLRERFVFAYGQFRRMARQVYTT